MGSPHGGASHAADHAAGRCGLRLDQRPAGPPTPVVYGCVHQPYPPGAKTPCAEGCNGDGWEIRPVDYPLWRDPPRPLNDAEQARWRAARGGDPTE